MHLHPQHRRPVPAQRAGRAHDRREPGGGAVHGQHGQDVAAGVHALEQAVEHRRDVVLGHRRDEADGAAGVGHVGPAGQQLAAEDVVDGGHGTDLDIGHATIVPRRRRRRAHDLLARRGADGPSVPP